MFEVCLPLSPKVSLHVTEGKDSWLANPLLRLVNDPSSYLGADTPSDLDESDAELFANEDLGEAAPHSVLIEDLGMLISK